MRRALVLAGGGVAGIAWELGVLLGIQDEDPELHGRIVNADVVVGTSAGSTVAPGLPMGTLTISGNGTINGTYRAGTDHRKDGLAAAW